MPMCRRRRRSNLLHLRPPRCECSAKAPPAVDFAQQAPAGRSAAGCCSVALRGGCHSQAEALGTMSDANNSAKGQRLLKTNAGTGLPSPLPLGQCSTSIRPVALRSLPCHTGNLHERHASGPQLYELLGRNPFFGLYVLASPFVVCVLPRMSGGSAHAGAPQICCFVESVWFGLVQRRFDA
jgi:hypothetical protein